MTVFNKIKKRENIYFNQNNFFDNSWCEDCFYKCLSQYLYGKELYHQAIRKKIYENLLNKQDSFDNSDITINIGKKIYK